MSIVQALRKHDTKLALDLLLKGANPNECDLSWTPLHLAVQEGDVELVKALLSKGARLDSKTKNGNTPLICGCMSSTANEKAIEALLSHDRTHVNILTSMRNSNGDTALMFACSANRPAVVKMLLDRNAKETDSNRSGMTALMCAAAAKGAAECVRLLLQKNRSPEYVNRSDSNGNTALHFAALACNHQAVDLLLREGAEISRGNARSKNPLEELLANYSDRNDSSSSASSSDYTRTHALLSRYWSELCDRISAVTKELVAEWEPTPTEEEEEEKASQAEPKISPAAAKKKKKKAKKKKVTAVAKTDAEPQKAEDEEEPAVEEKEEEENEESVITLKKEETKPKEPEKPLPPSSSNAAAAASSSSVPTPIPSIPPSLSKDSLPHSSKPAAASTTTRPWTSLFTQSAVTPKNSPPSSSSASLPKQPLLLPSSSPKISLDSSCTFRLQQLQQENAELSSKLCLLNSSMQELEDEFRSRLPEASGLDLRVRNLIFASDLSGLSFSQLEALEDYHKKSLNHIHLAKHAERRKQAQAIIGEIELAGMSDIELSIFKQGLSKKLLAVLK